MRAESLPQVDKHAQLPMFVVLCLGCGSTNIAVYSDYVNKGDVGGVHLVCMRCKHHVDVMETAQSLEYALSEYIEEGG